MLTGSWILDVLSIVLMVLALKRSAMPMVMRWGLAVLLSLALTSLAFVATLIVTDTKSLFVLFWLAYLVPTLFALKGCHWSTAAVDDTPARLRWLPYLTIVACLFALSAVILASVNNPFGGWDAWAIWNLKARFIFFGIDDGSWARLFAPVWSHPDYPLLLPATVARYWLLIGEPAPWVPASIGALVFALVCLLLHAGVRSCRGRLSADLAIIVLLGATFFTQHAGSQFADHYLALVVLAAAIIFNRMLDSQQNDEQPWGTSYLFGTLLGLAASIKNEGVLISLTFIVVYLVVLLIRRHKQPLQIVRSVAPCAAAWLFIMLPSLFMRFKLDLSNDVIGAMSLQHVLDSMSWDRVSMLFQLVSPLAADYFVVPVILLVAAATTGWVRVQFTKAPNATMVFVLTWLIIDGYLLVLWFTPHDLAWHVDTAFQRLLVHVWPAMVFALGSMLFVAERNTAGTVLQSHVS